MNRLLWLSALLCLGALLAGCSTLRVSTDYDPAAVFSGLNTYAWITNGNGTRGDPRLKDAQLDALVKDAVEAEMARRGLRKATTGEPDVLVAC